MIGTSSGHTVRLKWSHFILILLVFSKYAVHRSVDPIGGLKCCTYPTVGHVPHVFEGGNFDERMIRVCGHDREKNRGRWRMRR
jgi:hypothetical protein